MRHTWKETMSGLRRNGSMALAVIVTMWVSLALFGLGLLANQQVDLIKGRWYDKIEITVFLCTAQTEGTNCTPGVDVTDQQRQVILRSLQANAEVQTVYYESKAETYEDFVQVYEGSPVLDTVTAADMQDSFRIKLKDPQQYRTVVADVGTLPGVQSVQDLREYLEPMFDWLNLGKWGTITISSLLLTAAALQIFNTIRMTALARTQELQIMRLVGASNLMIMLPFLLESLIASLGGAVLAGATLVVGEKLLIIDQAQVAIQSIPWVGWLQVGYAMGGIVVVGIVLSIIPTLLSTRGVLKI